MHDLPAVVRLQVVRGLPEVVGEHVGADRVALAGIAGPHDCHVLQRLTVTTDEIHPHASEAFEVLKSNDLEHERKNQDTLYKRCSMNPVPAE